VAIYDHEMLNSISMPELDTVPVGWFSNNPNLPACSIALLLAQLSSIPTSWFNIGNDEVAACP
jgi:hypothetical protein